MPKLCGFPTGGSAKPVYINPTQVRVLRSGPTYTTIHFDNDHSIGVNLPIEQVWQALNEAMKDG